jgi:hypothetical protein
MMSRRRFLNMTGTLMAAAGTSTRAFAADTPPPNVDQWLAQNTRIANAIIWDGGAIMPYRSWPSNLKAALKAAFELAWHNRPSGLLDPAPNLSDNPPPKIFKVEDKSPWYITLMP